MSYFHTCPNCSTNLDIGEICDCVDALIGALLILAKGAAEHWGQKRTARCSEHRAAQGGTGFDRHCFRLHYIRKTEEIQV